VINQHIADGDATHVSVYLVDLLNGPTLGINQNEQFQPASLLKLPILMAYYKLSEEKPDLLSQKLGYTGSLNTGSQVITEAQTIQPNTSYTVEELLHRMIVYSDNKSKELLRTKLPDLSGDPNYLLNTYVNLGLIDLEQTDDETITVKMYSSLFRLLFNESFLTPHRSNEALDLLSKTVYDSGLVAGVPQGVKVSHKFGESSTDELKQLHDCGIIYYSDNPYSLCVMTRGKDPAKLEKIISTISGAVYKEIDSRRIK
jgi:beta-lactamase class A